MVKESIAREAIRRKHVFFLFIYDLRSFKSLEGDRWVVIQLDLSFLLHCTYENLVKLEVLEFFTTRMEK